MEKIIKKKDTRLEKEIELKHFDNKCCQMKPKSEKALGSTCNCLFCVSNEILLFDSRFFDVFGSWYRRRKNLKQLRLSCRNDQFR